MLVNKITVGFVIQIFDTELKQFVLQEFVAGDVAYEDMKGEVVDDVDGYLPFNMVQPEPPRKCVRVEYDLNYRGGDYDKVGNFAFIPLDAIDRLPGNDPDKNLQMAFTVLVGDPQHIVHYTLDEVYDQDGNECRE